MTTGQFARIINYFCWRQDIDRRGALGYIRNRKTEEKKSSKTEKPQKKFGQNRKPHTEPSKTDTMVTSGAYRAN